MGKASHSPDRPNPGVGRVSGDTQVPELAWPLPVMEQREKLISWGLAFLAVKWG